MSQSAMLNVLEISDDTALIVFIIIECIYTLILLPLSIYYSRELWQLHKSNIAFICKRRPQMVIFSIILTNIYLIIIKSITDLPYIYDPLSIYYNRTISILFGDMIYLIAYVILFRVWLLFYDYQYGVHLLSVQWKKHILKEENYKPWTLRYKWMGNIEVIFSIMIICWIIAVILEEFGSWLISKGNGNANLLQLPTFIIVPIGLMVMGCKVRDYKDPFFLKKEFKLSGIHLLISTVLYIILMCITDRRWNIRILCNNIIVGYAAFSLVFVYTLWVINKYKKEISRKEIENINNKLSLKQILSTKIGFKLFADHLVRELSIEHLLFLYETMEIKYQLLYQRILNNNNVGRLIPMDYQHHYKKYRKKRFDEEIIKHRLREIIETYIDQKGDHGINISSFTRYDIMDILNELYDEGIIASSKLIYVTSNSLVPSDTECVINNNKGIESTQSSMTRAVTMSNESDENHDNHHNDIVLYINKLNIAIEEVVKLLKCDSLRRFYETDQYNRMIKDASN